MFCASPSAARTPKAAAAAWLGLSLVLLLLNDGLRFEDCGAVQKKLSSCASQSLKSK